MLIWKTNSLDVNIASVRYRCLLPLRYLKLQGYKSLILYGSQKIPFNLSQKYDAIIFVKSFTSYDLSLARQANQARIPIILDICDNLFIDEYAPKADNKPSDFFKQMSVYASAIITTGEALKNVIDREKLQPIPVFMIPDGNETLADVEGAILLIRRWKKWIKIANFEPFYCYKQIRNKLQKIINHYINNSFKNGKKIIKKMRGYKKFFQLSYWNKIIAESKYKYIPFTEHSQRQESISAFYIALLPTKNSYNKSQNISKQIICTPNKDQHHLSSNEIAKELAPETKKDYQRIIWFGNHGARYGNFGMLNILDIADYLINISHDIKFSLIVVSNNYEKYNQHILPLPFFTEYIEWEPLKIYKYVSESDVTIIPNSKSDFSICKSANRAVLSLSLGVPVVATKTPALIPFEECTIIDNWEQGLREYLTNKELANSHIKKAQSTIQKNYSGEAIANQWINVLNQVVRKGM